MTNIVAFPTDKKYSIIACDPPWAYDDKLTGGKVISFGWNSCGIGKTRGFEIERILIVCHGGHHNDTICTVEKKVQGSL